MFVFASRLCAIRIGRAIVRWLLHSPRVFLSCIVRFVCMSVPLFNYIMQHTTVSATTTIRCECTIIQCSLSHWLLRLFIVVLVHHGDTRSHSVRILSLALCFRTQLVLCTQKADRPESCASWAEWKLKLPLSQLAHTRTRTNERIYAQLSVNARSVCLLFRCHDPNARQPFEIALRNRAGDMHTTHRTHAHRHKNARFTIAKESSRAHCATEEIYVRLGRSAATTRSTLTKWWKSISRVIGRATTFVGNLRQCLVCVRLCRSTLCFSFQFQFNVRQA